MTQESRQPTGVPGLDAVLAGPIVPGSLVFIVGPPGAGKTILASQSLFAAARRGEPTLLFTSYAETQTKLLQHLRSFAFFDETLVGGLVSLRALPDLKTMDVQQSTALLIRMLRESNARLAMIDGFQSVEPMLGSPQALHQLLAGVSTQLTYIDATLIVTLTGDARDLTSSSSLTVADTLLGLNYQLIGTRHIYTLEVVKQRARAQLPGRHAYRLNDQGVIIFPRIEAYPQPQISTPSLERMPFGLPELDALLHGGPHQSTTTVLAGAPGVGKTTLALHWALQGARPEAPTIFLTMREYEAQLALKAATFGLDLQAAIASGAVRVLRVSPVELDVDQLGVQLLEALTQNPARLVIDDLAPLLRELGARGHDYIAALAAHLYGMQVTTLALLEIAPFAGFRLDLVDTPLGTIGENVLILQQHEAGGVLHRVLAVLRMRLSSYDRTLRELVIGEQGVRVLHPSESPPEVISRAADNLGNRTDPGQSPHSEG